MFAWLRVFFDSFWGQWSIFIAASVLGARWIHQGLRDTVPRDALGEYAYAGPKAFLTAGVLFQVPIVMRLALYHSAGA